MDLTLVLLSLPFVLPLFALCALLIKLESPGGPVMFKQKRTGKGGHPFDIYKFRTMVPNAEELKKELAHLNELQWPDFKITHDPRITRMGRFLRKTSLDELPQLLNVLRGEMSLVGPRPTSFSPETYDLWHTERLDVMPGITGLWQIMGRGAMEFDDRVRLDVAYIERRCLWLDVQILLRTFTAVLQQRGAH
ncbi:MAG: sugar transferase [Anaerolineales bacterium]|nr:sugar transferase [Anaerolineales bacterium]